MFWFRRLVSALLLLMASTPSGFGGDLPAQFDVRKIEGKEYVTLKSVASFYEFRGALKGDWFVMNSGRILAKFQIGSTAATLNGVPLHLARQVRVVEEESSISRIDLEKLIHPLLMPGNIVGLEPFTTLIFDAGPADVATEDPKRRYSIPPHVIALRDAIVARTKQGNPVAQAKIKVVSTFGKDGTACLEERLAIIGFTPKPAAVFSLRLMKGEGKEGSITTYCLSPAGVAHMGRNALPSDLKELPGNATDQINTALSLAVHWRIARGLDQEKALDGGVVWARDAILTGAMHPAALIEIECGSAGKEVEYFDKEEVRTAIANGLVDGLRGLERGAR